ncbi:MAG: hypothetical protein FD138_1299 [Planctomycetota bacterium]|nr:MAG: hypothetical protein FD138_1299 [Planctomycetota bacterium]
MNRRSLILSLGSAMALASCLVSFKSAVADEPKAGALLQSLPKDGAWVEYNVNLKLNDQEFVPSWTLRSVGQAFHGGKQCRIIEMEQSSDVPQFPKTTWRVVVPEDEFGDGKDPISKAGKVWIKQAENEPAAVESIALRDPIFAMLLAGPKQNLKSEEATEKINWQQGDLECAVLSGHNELELGTAKFSMVHRIFRHKDVPFGLAGMTQEITVSVGGQKQTAIVKMSLRDHGKDAKAKLPDLVP